MFRSRRWISRALTAPTPEAGTPRRTLARAGLGLLLAAVLAAPATAAAASPAPEAPASPALSRLAADPALQIPGFDIDAFANPTTQKPSVLWFWNRTQTKAQTDQTLQDMHDAGFTEVVIFRMNAEPFFSQAWFDRVDNVLRKAQQLGLKVRLDNDSQFPSGAAGGLIVNGGQVGTKTYQPHPDMRVKTAYEAASLNVEGGQDIDLGPLIDAPIRIVDGEVIADATQVPGVTLLRDGAGWTDYTATAHFAIETATAGFMVRSPDPRNGYLIDVKIGGTVDVWKQVNGSFTQLRKGQSHRPSWNQNGYHDVTISFVGSTLDITLDGVAEAPLTDGTFAAGGVGMRVDGTQRWRLDELSVAGPGGAPLYASDYEDDASITDFAFTTAPLENVIAVTARPADDNGDLSKVVDLTSIYTSGQPWSAPAGSWVLQAFAFQYRNSGYLDSLETDAQELYNQVVMDEYYERFGWAFGNVLVGFADDESELSYRERAGAVPYTPELVDRLAAAGHDIAPTMVAVFSDLGREGTTARAAYYQAASDQWVEAYWKPKYDWTEAHGVTILSNPLWDEHGPAEGLRLSGNFLTMHQWVQIPGTDLIGNNVESGAARFLPRTAASVAHQLGRPLVYDEIMGATGWQKSLDDTREATAISALRGINYTLFHTTYDSIDGIPYPPVFMKQNTWWPWINDLNEWTGRLMEFGRHTTAAPTALLNMARSNEALQRTDDWQASDTDWIATENALEDSQVDFDLLDEGALSDDPAVLAHATVADGALHVGEMTYTTVVVPRAPYLSLEAATTLRDLVDDGGKVVWTGAPPAKEIEGRDDQLADVVAQIDERGGARVVTADGPGDAGRAAAGLGQAAVTLSSPQAGVRVLRFSQDGTDGYLLSNESGVPVTVDVTFPSHGLPAVWDPETGDVSAASTYRETDDGVVVPMTLDPRAPLGVTVSADDGRAHVTKVIGDGDGTSEVTGTQVVDGQLTATVRTEASGTLTLRGEAEGQDLAGTGTTVTVPDPVALDGDWHLALGDGSTPVDRPLKSWTDLAPFYSGSATYTKQVTLTPEQLAGTDWRLDLGKVANVAEVSVNGQSVGTRIWAPYTLGLAGALHEGTNIIQVKVTNTDGNARGQKAYDSGLLGPVSLVPSVTQDVTLHPTSVTALSASATVDDAATVATVSLTVANTGTTPVTGTVVASGPQGWTAKRSEPVTVAPGGTASATSTLFPGGFLDPRETPVSAAFVVDGDPVDSASTTITPSFPTPPETFTDHVDLGNAASEAAHHLTASPTSGTNTEAGLTRRYGGYRIPDAWYEFDLTVEAGKGFVLQGLETYDASPQKKSYLVSVNGELVATRLNLRPLRQIGTAAYRLYVPARFVTSSTVRVRLQSRTDPDYADPSLADVWALPSQDDTTPPEATATVHPAAGSAPGWSRGPATVELTATDDRDAEPTLEWSAGDGSDDTSGDGTDGDDGWQPYTAPIPITVEGTTTLQYRATDAAGNTSAPQSVTVQVDSIFPTVTGTVSDARVLTVVGQDANLARTQYSLDGITWSDYLAPVPLGDDAQDVRLRATDQAGNTSPVVTVHVDARSGGTVPPPPGTTITVTKTPVVSGKAKVGKTLRATPGAYSVPGVTVSYQWLRAGVSIKGATSATYTLTKADKGRQLSVRVTASKAGYSTVAATSAATGKVKAGTIKVTKKATIKGKAKVGTRLKVTKGTYKPAGKTTIKVRWLRGSKTIKGATSRRYKLKAADRGKKLKVKVTVKKPGYATKKYTTKKTTTVH